MSHGWLVPLLGAAIVAAASGCGEQNARGVAADDQGESSRASAAPVAVQTAAVPADPCDWIPLDQVAALIGSPSGGEPCSLVTAQEAEAVLGKLVVPPYRSYGALRLAQIAMARL